MEFCLLKPTLQKITSALLRQIITTVEGKERALGCAVSNLSQVHSLPDTASLPCRKCTHPISESSTASWGFWNHRPLTAMKFYIGSLPENLPGIETAGQQQLRELVKRTEYHRLSLLIIGHVCERKGCREIWILNQPDRNFLSDKTFFLYC